MSIIPQFFKIAEGATALFLLTFSDCQSATGLNKYSEKPLEVLKTMFLKYTEGLFERVAFKEIGWISVLIKIIFRIPENSLWNLCLEIWACTTYCYRLTEEKSSLSVPK